MTKQFENEGKLITSPILDRIGQEITPGCIIAYGHALGRCAGLRLGKVLKIVGIIKEETREIREYRITVRGIDDDWFDINQPDLLSWNGNKHSDDVKLLEKKSTLMFPSRTVALVYCCYRQVETIWSEIGKEVTNHASFYR